MLTGFLAIVFVFGLIVIVHEWGHMMAAKLCGVAVPDFAIGMGPSLWSRVWRGTRYHLCLIPIGGYVQIAGLVGDDPVNAAQEARRKRADLDELEKQGAPADAATAVAGEGPIPYELTNGGRLTKRWQDINGFQRSFILVAGVLMNFVLAFVVILLQGFVGFPDNSVMVTQVQPGLAADAAGVKSGDVALKLAGTRVETPTQFAGLIAQHSGEAVPLVVRRGQQELTLNVTPQVSKDADGKPYNDGKPSLGVGLQLISDMTTKVGVVTLNSPASNLGFKRGDRITAVNGEPVTDGLQVLLALASYDPQTLAAVDGNGQPIPQGGGTRQITVPGDVTLASFGVLFTERLQRLPPGAALVRSLHDGWEMMGTMVASMKLLFTKVGAQSISGPIGIFSMLGQSAQSDLYTFLMWVILINVNLGMLNLLPLPALDGGRLVFVALGGLGIRVPERREALVHAAGMLVILAFAVLISIRDVGGLIRGWTAH
jgi:regulator of sigma E protease